MFKKLLKYDMTYVWRIWRILALVSVISTAVSIGAAFIIGGIIKNDPTIDSVIFAILTIFLTFLMMAAMMGIFVGLIGTEILVFARFYTHFYSDEGYLTFTLPVSRKQLFLSKTVNAVFWTAIQCVITAICFVAFILSLFFAVAGDNIPFDLFTGIFKTLWEGAGAWIFVYGLELIALLLVACFFSVSLIHFCITIGAVIAKKAKLLAGVGIYYVISSVVGTAAQIFFWILTLTIFPGLNQIFENGSDLQASAALALMFFIFIVIYAIMAVTIYCLTLDKIERRLNLA